MVSLRGPGPQGVTAALSTYPSPIPEPTGPQSIMWLSPLVVVALKHDALALEEYTNPFALGCVQRLKEMDPGAAVTHTSLTSSWESP